MLIISDITSSIAYDKLQRTNEMLKILQSCYSHDMKTPLGIILQLAESALMNDEMPE